MYDSTSDSRHATSELSKWQPYCWESGEQEGVTRGSLTKSVLHPDQQTRNAHPGNFVGPAVTRKANRAKLPAFFAVWLIIQLFDRSFHVAADPARLSRARSETWPPAGLHGPVTCLNPSSRLDHHCLCSAPKQDMITMRVNSS